jgi:disulfide bond formation protein DsbB
MERVLTGRLPYFVVTVACAAMLGYAYYAEWVLGLEPCPLCMLQRLAFIGIAVVALLAAIIGPKAWGRWLAAVAMLPASIWGMVTAGRHIWLQSLPADQVPDCGPGLYFMQTYGFTWLEIVREAFTGSGECAEVDWSLFGLSMPVWTLIAYVGLTVVMLAAAKTKQGKS